MRVLLVWTYVGVGEYRYRDKLKEKMIEEDMLCLNTKVIVQVISTICHKTTNLKLVPHSSNLLLASQIAKWGSFSMLAYLFPLSGMQIRLSNNLVFVHKEKPRANLWILETKLQIGPLHQIPSSTNQPLIPKQTSLTSNNATQIILLIASPN